MREKPWMRSKTAEIVKKPVQKKKRKKKESIRSVKSPSICTVISSNVQGGGVKIDMERPE